MHILARRDLLVGLLHGFEQEPRECDNDLPRCPLSQVQPHDPRHRQRQLEAPRPTRNQVCRPHRGPPVAPVRRRHDQTTPRATARPTRRVRPPRPAACPASCSSKRRRRTSMPAPPPPCRPASRGRTPARCAGLPGTRRPTPPRIPGAMGSAPAPGIRHGQNVLGLILRRKHFYGSRSKRGLEVASLDDTALHNAKLAGVEPREYLVRMRPRTSAERASRTDSPSAHPSAAEA